MKQWLTLREAAARLGISHVTLWRRVRDGKFAADVRVGSSWFFDPARIDEIAAQKGTDRKAA